MKVSFLAQPNNTQNATFAKNANLTSLFPFLVLLTKHVHLSASFCKFARS